MLVISSVIRLERITILKGKKKDHDASFSVNDNVIESSLECFCLLELKFILFKKCLCLEVVYL